MALQAHAPGLTGVLDVGIYPAALDLTGTKVTARGLAALQKALPKCKTKWGSEKK